MTDIRYISTKEAAGIMGLSTRRVVGLCNAGKLEGALRKGRNWKVPEETAYAYIGTEKPKAGNGEILSCAVGNTSYMDVVKNSYYVDKTNLIKELLESRIAEVTLITRPRRFGKTIGMSMLAYFFDIRKDSRKLFEDLKISRDIELCQKWMNQYPTLFISFKDVDGLNFQSAMKMLRNQISWICNEHDYLSDSDKVNENDKKIFLKLQDISEENLSEDLIKISVATIIRMMNVHYGKPVILLLDEYDVPLSLIHI